MKRFRIGVLCTVLGLSSTAGLAAGNNNGPVFGGGGDTNANANAVQGQQQGQTLTNTNVIAPHQSQAVNLSNRNDNTNINSNRADANSASFSGSSSKSGAVAGAFSGGNTQSITVTDSGRVDYSGGYTIKNVPNIALGNVYPTSPCMGSTQGSGSGIGFGIGFGTSWTDDECSIRETARSFAGMGLLNDALKVLCTSQFAAAAPSCVTVTQLPAATQAAVAPSQTGACYSDEVVARRMGKPVCQ